MNAYPAYKESDKDFVKQIPAHWDIMKFKRACRMITDGSHFSPPTQDTGSYYVTVRNIVNGEVDLSDAARISQEHFENLEKTNCRPKIGDVLFSKDGTVGKVALVKRDDFVILSSLAILRPSEKVDSKFLSYFVQSPNGKNQIESWFAGAALKRITLDTIINLYAIVPPIDEQKFIVDFLDRKTSQIDALIEKKQRQIELLHEQRVALINQAVTKGLNPSAPMKESGVEWLGEIPRHWDCSKIKYLAQVISKGTTPTTIGGQFTDKGIRFIKAENIVSGKVVDYPESYIDDETNELLKRSTLQHNDILMVIAGATTGKVGIIEQNHLPANTNQAVAFVRLVDERLVRYVFYWLSCSLIQNFVWLQAVQSAQPNLSLGSIGNFIIPYPPIEEALKIVEFINKNSTKIEALIYKENKILELLQEYRTALIAEAVTGKIDVRA